MDKARLNIIINSFFFVLGFSLVFSALGVLLQTLLSSFAFEARNILNWVGGTIIIFFGLVMMNVIKFDFLQKEHKLQVKKTNFQYLSSLLFGGAFAVGWTPCVGAILGAVITLAATNPGVAFPLMVAYSLGLGLPFILAAVFISQSTGVIKAIAPHLKWFNFVFGAIIVLLGIMVFTNTLAIVASLLPAEEFFMAEFEVVGTPTILITFLAGLVSFFSPCILPLVPAYLTFIAGTSLKEIQGAN